MDTPPLPLLNAIEARVLGSLIEKKELTPDVYPLTLNAAQAAANQKTAREPVMALEPSDIHRAFKTLQEKGLVRQVAGSRVERYEEQLSRRFSLTRGQTSLLGLMLLRGPQRRTSSWRAASAWRAMTQSRTSSPISTFSLAGVRRWCSWSSAVPASARTASRTCSAVRWRRRRGPLLPRRSTQRRRIWRPGSRPSKRRFPR